VSGRGGADRVRNNMAAGVQLEHAMLAEIWKNTYPYLP
jgi:hypothetical protein